MAASFLGRALISKPAFASLVARSFTSSSLACVPSVHHRLRFLIAVKEYYQPPAVTGVRYFSTRPTTSFLNYPSPNWSNRPPKETILDDGCDFEHWLIVMEPPDEDATRDDIIDSYIKTLAQVVGSEDEARKKIYSVSSRVYFGFGCLVSEELSYKIKELPKVGWVVPDAYWDMKNKVYPGEPFIDGKAVPYDPKYHEEWGSYKAHPKEISRQNDRPRNFDRWRNFERRRDNMQKWDINTASSHPGGAPANPGYQNQGVGGVPPARGVPTIKVECENEAVRGAPTIKYESELKWQVYDEFHKQYRDIEIGYGDTFDYTDERVVYRLVFNVVPA